LKPTILVVEPDSAVRNILTMLLVSAGYQVSTAEHGFDALEQLKKVRPDVLISDLTMPRMSGFELLSVVRCRFPEISVMAMSGAYDGRDLPCGVISDMFYSKGQNDPGVFLEAVAALIRSSGSRAVDHQREKAPVWVPRNGAHLLLTCAECLRPFPLDISKQELLEIRETPCIFCRNPIRYVIDSSADRAPFAPQARRTPDSAVLT